jgi:hypothetical protein
MLQIMSITLAMRLMRFVFSNVLTLITMSIEEVGFNFLPKKAI